MTQSGILSGRSCGGLVWFFRFGVTPTIPFCFQRQQDVTFGQIFQFGLNTAPVLLLRFREELLRYLLVFFDGVHLLPLHIWSLFGNAKSKAL